MIKFELPEFQYHFLIDILMHPKIPRSQSEKDRYQQMWQDLEKQRTSQLFKL